jgi:hypothetical protein
MREEGGAIFIFLAIVIPVLVTLAAMAVDLGFATAAREQGEHFARLAALAALESYTQTRCSDEADQAACDLEKAAAAEERAQAISQKNFLLAAAGQSARLRDPDSGTAILERGQWLTTASMCSPEPAPCFLPRSGSADMINAYRVRGKLYPSFTTKLFGDMLGSGSIPLSVLATAALVPREGIFLVDNSRSVTRETHRLWIPRKDPPESGPPENKGQEFAYFRGALNSGYVRNYHDISWEWLTKNMPKRGADKPASSPELHYADDYVEKWTYSDADYATLDHHELHPEPDPSDPENLYNASSQRLRFEIDMYRDSGKTGYQGPQPLGRIFRALHTAMSRFEDQKIQGDKAGLIFYDHRLAWPRVVKLDSDFEYLKHLTNLDNEGGINDREEILRHGLFPSYNAYTNTPAALSEAYKQFAESAQLDPSPKSRFIVLFGDGLTNCSCDQSVEKCMVECDNSYLAYRTSMQEIQKRVETQLSSDNIPIHVLITGDYVAPHTVDIERPDAPGVCYSDSEYRAIAGTFNPFGFVMGGDEAGNEYATEDEWEQAFAAMGPDRPFYQVNKDLYKIAAVSQGLWIPLRPPAPRDESGKCTPAPCTPGTRRLFDDRCRSVEDQMSEAINRIIGERPYLIVQAE